MRAYENGEVRKCVAEDWKDYNYDEGWSRTNNRNRFRVGSEKAAPRTFYPAGPRFSIDQAGDLTPPKNDILKIECLERGTGFWFTYLDWECHVSMRYGTGLDPVFGIKCFGCSRYLAP